MKLRTTATMVTALTGIGAASGGAAYVLATSPAAVSITTASASAPLPSPSAAAAAPRRCEDGAWIGPDGINVNRRPDQLDRGDDGSAYIWHGVDGWHLRTTDVQNVAHHYTGTITVSPGVSVTYLRPVMLEKDDRVWLTSDVIHYDLTTYAGVDGFDFRVSACDGARAHETLRFSLDYNGHEQDTARIKLGDEKGHPPAATFDVRRSER
jgi:hypothetical protein